MAGERATAAAADGTGVTDDLAVAEDGLFRTQADARHLRRFVRLPGIVDFFLLFAHLAFGLNLSCLAMRPARIAAAALAAGRRLQNVQQIISRSGWKKRRKIFRTQAFR